MTKTLKSRVKSRLEKNPTLRNMHRLQAHNIDVQALGDCCHHTTGQAEKACEGIAMAIWATYCPACFEARTLWPVQRHRFSDQ